MKRLGTWLVAPRISTHFDMLAFCAIGYVLGAGYSGWRVLWSFLGLNATIYFVHLYKVRLGLDQWPEPSGPYYDRWLNLDNAGNYYEWLAKQKNNAEPWRTWARWDRKRV